MFLWIIIFFAGHFGFINGCFPPAEITFNFIDASAKIPSGILSGNLGDIGAFDQCLLLDLTHNETRYKGKYCLVKVPLPMDFINSGDKEKNKYIELQNRIVISTNDQNGPSLLLGWCIPDICPIENITEEIMDKVHPFTSLLPDAFINISVIPFMGGLCQTQEEINSSWSAGELVTLVFLGAVGCIMVLSTIYDMYIHYTNKCTAHILFIAFSIRTNGEKLLAISHNPDQLSCLHGIRFISMMWVIYAHRHLIFAGEPVLNISDFKKFQEKFMNMYIIGAGVSVDTFFVLSGLLVGYGFFQAKSKGIQFNICKYWAHRYIRFTPALGVSVLVFTVLLGRFGTGPFWPFSIKHMNDVCVRNWWATLLYIDNYYGGNVMCLGHSWYLAVDIQLFFLSPLILLPMCKWPQCTLYAAFALVLGSMVIPFVVSYHYNLPAGQLQEDGSAQYLSKYYVATHARFGPWLIGLILGYYIHKIKNNINEQYKMNRAVLCVGWTIAAILLLTTLYGSYPFSFKHDRLDAAFFNALHRHGWALGIVWVIFACTHGYGGPINAFLSWSPFQIFGRLTYTMYLVHFVVQIVVLSLSRTTTYYSEFKMVYNYWGDFFITLVVAIGLSLSFELPMLVIEKILFTAGGETKKSQFSITTKKEKSHIVDPENVEFVTRHS